MQDIETELNLNAEYENRLKRFEKYQKRGIDIVYKCFGCKSYVYQMDILYGVACRKCGSRRVTPIMQNLTWFGAKYCRFFNWLWKNYYEKIRFKNDPKIT